VPLQLNSNRGFNCKTECIYTVYTVNVVNSILIHPIGTHNQCDLCEDFSVATATRCDGGTILSRAGKAVRASCKTVREGGLSISPQDDVWHADVRSCICGRLRRKIRHNTL